MTTRKYFIQNRKWLVIAHNWHNLILLIFQYYLYERLGMLVVSRLHSICLVLFVQKVFLVRLLITGI